MDTKRYRTKLCAYLEQHKEAVAVSLNTIKNNEKALLPEHFWQAYNLGSKAIAILLEKEFSSITDT